MKNSDSASGEGNLALRRIYEAKDASYYGQEREEMLRFVPDSAARVLEVGCGAGAFASRLKSGRRVEVWGVEPDSSAANIARDRLDCVIEGLFEPEVALPKAYFDCIVFNDVLEHLLDAEGALTLAKQFLTPNGCVVGSIPNVAHFPTAARLFLRGSWQYTDQGILDRTHLRFFTKQSIERMLASSGFHPDLVEGLNALALMQDGDQRWWMVFRILSVFRFAHLQNMRYLQFAFRAFPAPEGSADHLRR